MFVKSRAVCLFVLGNYFDQDIDGHIEVGHRILVFLCQLGKVKEIRKQEDREKKDWAEDEVCH